MEFHYTLLFLHWSSHRPYNHVHHVLGQGCCTRDTYCALRLHMKLDIPPNLQILPILHLLIFLWMTKILDILWNIKWWLCKTWKNLKNSNLLKSVCLLIVDTWAWIFITSLCFDIRWAISGTIVSPIFWNWIVTLTISFAISPSTRNWAFLPFTKISPTTVYF